jgi:hypothetical protein
MSQAADKSLPVDILGVVEGSSESILLLEGETDVMRAAGREVIARTRCRMRFNSEAQLLACVDAIRESGERMREVPPEQALYKWERTFRHGMNVLFSVAWYDQDFFEGRKDAYKSQLHTSLFDRFGISADEFHIEHEVL